MSWFRKSPFSGQEEAAQHMVDLLAKEAESAGTPLSDRDKDILLQDHRETNSLLTDELRQKATDSIRRLYELETSDENFWDPLSFGNSLEWGGDTRYPNIVALAEEVSCDMARMGPPLHGWKRFKDKLLLIGCGLLVVVLMMVIGITISSFFPDK
jgi:hypothetical protein